LLILTCPFDILDLKALYGLLLPSGNDASVALAEHFGERCKGLHTEGHVIPLKRKPKRSSHGDDAAVIKRRDSYNSFVAAMNQLMTVKLRLDIMNHILVASSPDVHAMHVS